MFRFIVFCPNKMLNLLCAMYSSILGQNYIFGQNSVKDANVPASTFLLDWNQLRSTPSATRDELFRMQRNTFIGLPTKYHHHKGLGRVAAYELPNQFNLFNPFSPNPQVAASKPLPPVSKSLPIAPSKPKQLPQSALLKSNDAFAPTPQVTAPKPLQPVSKSLPIIPSKPKQLPKAADLKSKDAFNKILKLQEFKRLQQIKKKIEGNTPSKFPEKLPRKVEPFFPSLPKPISERRSGIISDSLKSGGSDHQIIRNSLSRFKVYQAVPDEDF